jgi:hypothetical protein
MLLCGVIWHGMVSETTSSFLSYFILFYHLGVLFERERERDGILLCSTHSIISSFATRGRSNVKYAIPFALGILIGGGSGRRPVV